MDYRFIKTVDRGRDGKVAMFADKDVLKDSGVEAIRSASKMPSVFNSIRSREGIHFLNKAEIGRMLFSVVGVEGKEVMVQNLERARTVMSGTLMRAFDTAKVSDTTKIKHTLTI